MSKSFVVDFRKWELLLLLLAPPAEEAKRESPPTAPSCSDAPTPPSGCAPIAAHPPAIYSLSPASITSRPWTGSDSPGPPLGGAVGE